MKANIDNGRQVLLGIIDRITDRHGTDDLDQIVWQEDIEAEMSIMNDEPEGWRDLCDLMAYVLGMHDDAEDLANIACYGIAWCIASSLYYAHEADVECYLLG